MTPWTVAHQDPLSMGFFKQEYWTRLPSPSPGDLPDPEIEPVSLVSQADSLPAEPSRKQRHEDHRDCMSVNEERAPGLGQDTDKITFRKWKSECRWRNAEKKADIYNRSLVLRNQKERCKCKKP